MLTTLDSSVWTPLYRQHLISDFLIAALDRGYFRAYFPRLALLAGQG